MLRLDPDTGLFTTSVTLKPGDDLVERILFADLWDFDPTPPHSSWSLSSRLLLGGSGTLMVWSEDEKDRPSRDGPSV